MKEFCKHFKICGVHIYVSSVRMKRRRSVDEKLRNRRKELQRKKRYLYVKNGGCCDVCGKRLPLDGLELHHVVPLSENPRLAFSTKNLMLLCHGCHLQAHRCSCSVVAPSRR